MVKLMQTSGRKLDAKKKDMKYKNLFKVHCHQINLNNSILFCSSGTSSKKSRKLRPTWSSVIAFDLC